MSAMKLERKAAEKAVSSDGASASVMIKLQLLPEHLGADLGAAENAPRMHVHRSGFVF